MTNDTEEIYDSNIFEAVKVKEGILIQKKQSKTLKETTKRQGGKK